jgi:DNA-binding transcriptional LysR family regulator
MVLQSTDFVCTLPARFLSRYSDTLASFALPFDAGRFSLYAAWHARFDNDLGHAWLRRELMSSAED